MPGEACACCSCASTKEWSPFFRTSSSWRSASERTGTILLEHQRRAFALLDWLATIPVRDLAIGTEDLRSLYDQFHGPNVPDDKEVEALEV